MTSRTVVTPVAFAFVVLLALAGAADAAQLYVQTRDGTLEDVLGRGLDADSWIPVLDGHVYFNGEDGRLLVEYVFRPGGSELQGPIESEAGAGAGCLQVWDLRTIHLYIDDCLPD